jgi:hypothetical protein
VGTSKSFPTPSGGEWTPLKNDITDRLQGDQRVTADKIVGGTIRAAGGLNLPALGRTSAGFGLAGTGGSASGGTGGRGGGGGAGGSGSRSTSPVAQIASRLGGFGQAFERGGLDEALDSLGLEDLRGRPAAEIVARIAERLAEGADPLQHELLADALRHALLEAALMDEAVGETDLEQSLQSFLDDNGIEGLIEGFLANYVFDRVWMAIEEHAHRRGDSAASSEALGVAVAQACRAHVEALVQEAKSSRRFQSVDWFGSQGIELGAQLVAELESRLRAL